MKLFICWSGKWGERSAHRVKEWFCKDALPGVLKCDDILVSKDIAKGKLWFDELKTQLDKSSAALVCLTEEALRSPWVAYEVGAIAHALRSKSDDATACLGLASIFTLVLGVQVAEITGPLAAFQSTSVEDEKDMRQLILSLARLLLQQQNWVAAMSDEKWHSTWESLSRELKSMKMSVIDAFPDFDKLFRRKTFQEPTPDCVNQRWLERYEAIRDTWMKLRQMERTIGWACPPVAVEMYQALVDEVDIYAMTTSLLLGAKRYDIHEYGHVAFDQPQIGVVNACERSRRRIKTLVARLTDSSQAPKFNEAFRFEIADSLSEKKSLIHRMAEKKPGEENILGSGDEKWTKGDWDFDRIVYSLWLEQSVKENGSNTKRLLANAVKHATTDMEKARARQGSETSPDGSYLMSLTYALAPLECVRRDEASVDQPEELEYLVKSIEDLLKRDAEGRKLRYENGLPAEATVTYASITAIIHDSLKCIRRKFQLPELRTTPTSGG